MGSQECCGGISRNNPDINGGDAPYMIEKCLKDKSNWSRANCSESCCSDGGYCSPTEQGGFCHNSDRNRYYRYIEERNGDGNSISRPQYMYETDARRQYPYRRGEISGIPGGDGIHSFDDRRYDRSYAQAKRDIVNKFMENGIMGQDTAYKRGTEYSSDRIFTPTINVIILMLVLVVGISIINTVINRNKVYRLKRLFF